MITSLEIGSYIGQLIGIVIIAYIAYQGYKVAKDRITELQNKKRKQ